MWFFKHGHGAKGERLISDWKIAGLIPPCLPKCQSVWSIEPHIAPGIGYRCHRVSVCAWVNGNVTVKHLRPSSKGRKVLKKAFIIYLPYIMSQRTIKTALCLFLHLLLKASFSEKCNKQTDSWSPQYLWFNSLVSGLLLKVPWPFDIIKKQFFVKHSHGIWHKTGLPQRKSWKKKEETFGD